MTNKTDQNDKKCTEMGQPMDRERSDHYFSLQMTNKTDQNDKKCTEMGQPMDRERSNLSSEKPNSTTTTQTTTSQHNKITTPSHNIRTQLKQLQQNIISSSSSRLNIWSLSVGTMALVTLIVLLFYTLVHRQAVHKVKWMCNTDETDEPYNKYLQTKPEEKKHSPNLSGKCVVPTYPEHGTYIITNAPAAKPGESFQSLELTVKCLPDYGVLGTKIVICDDGLWSDSIPKCVRLCKLDNDSSVHYHCLDTGSIEGHRTCNAYEPSGTVVRPECNSPHYYSATALPFMRCIGGSWDYVAVCSPECGRVSSNGVDPMIGGRPAKRGELPWHVGIYRKNTEPYKQICGGSLVSNRLVVSAAHCFWNDAIKILPASKFAVAAGKIYRPWNNHRDVYAQKSDVKEINIPVRFLGSATNFQHDIALLVLETPFVFDMFVRPVCLDFDFNFDTRQLQPGKFGKVAGWGLTIENGSASQILKVFDLPYVGIEQCITAMPLDFTKYITSDKICAGYENGTTLWACESGGGLVFPGSDRGTVRYYLRGIVSIAADSGNLCNSYTLTTFTQILPHEHFVKRVFLESGQIVPHNMLTFART